MRQFIKAISVKTSKGMLSKAVYGINNELYLVNGCTEGCFHYVCPKSGSNKNIFIK